MAYSRLEKELESVNKIRSSYLSGLNHILPRLLNRCLALVRQKGIAAQLTHEFDNEGNYFNPSRRKMNGSGVYFAFSEGIIKMETIYNSEGLPTTKESKVTNKDFLDWVREKSERSEDVYRHIVAYKNEKPSETYFPSENIL